MLTDALTSLDGSHNAICIVGAGPVGLALATALARQGIRVLLLESGGKTADPGIQELAAGALV
ncbi:MAG: FAD-dependent oxidoreductase, partial [Cytophagaceae bacterium]